MQPGQAHTYDPANHTVIFGAINIDSGFGKDTWIEVVFESAGWEDDVGVDGEVTRSKINDARATARITMMASSKLNDRLTAHYHADRATPGGLGAKPFLLKDNGGTTKVAAEQAWIQKQPDQTRTRKAGEVVWEIRLANAVAFHGGNE